MNARRKVERWWWARFGPLASPQRWAFVVGCYNSGTTLLHALLAEHPQIGSLPTEGQFLTDQLVVPRDVGLARRWAAQPELFRMTELDGDGVDVARIMRQWGGRFNDVRRPVLVEHSPPNAARTRWLQDRFVPAHFVAIVRDGFAVSEGIRRRTGLELAEAALQWARSNEIMLDDFAHLERAIVVRYEELTEHPDRVLAELSGFLGLPPPAGSIEERTFEIHDRRSPIRNMNARSLATLTIAERSEIRAIAGPMLDRLGYS